MCYVMLSGEPIECYIMTGAKGAKCIRERVLHTDNLLHLRDRIESMLIVLPEEKVSDVEKQVTW